MHGTDWSGENVSGWWLSEKLDGWRCVWDGRTFLNRHGVQYTAPDWFVAGMPSTPLDGELWAGPGTDHNDVYSAVRSGQWRALTFRPFDVPIDGLPIEQAQATLRELPLPAHVKPVDYRRVESTKEARSIMRRIVKAGGEGAMLRRPRSGYFSRRRTTALLKLKP